MKKWYFVKANLEGVILASNNEIVEKAKKYENSPIGIGAKQINTLAWEKHKEFLGIYPFRTQPNLIDGLTPDAIYNPGPGKDYFLKWIEHKLAPLGHMGIGSAYYAINAKNNIDMFKELMHTSVNDSKAIWEKIDPWDAIKFWGGERQQAKKILFCYYPEEIMPISSQAHLINIGKILALDYEGEAKNRFGEEFTALTVGKQFDVLNKALNDFKANTDVLRTWDNAYFMRFLYDSFPQPKAKITYTSIKSTLGKQDKMLLLEKYKEGKITDAEIIQAFENNSADALVTKALNSLGIKKVPDYENEVLALFSKLHNELGFPVLVEVQPLFPDVIAENREGKEKSIELEVWASNFDHDPKGCDYLVCWDNDLGSESPKDFPEIISIKTHLLRAVGNTNVK